MFSKSAWGVFLLLLPGLGAMGFGAAPEAPVDGFFVPIFSTAGVKIGDVRGSKTEPMAHGENTRLHGICVRFFDGAGRVQMVVGGTEALLNLSEQEISGNEFVHVAGELFTALSTRWKIYGPARRVVMDRDVRVFFEIGIDDTVEGECGPGSDGRYTLITSASLQILSNSDSTIFDFTGQTEVLSGDFAMTCDALSVQSLSDGFWIIPGRLAGNGKIQKIDAHGNISALWGDKSLQADSCEIYPEENVVILSGNVHIGNEKGSITGGKFILRSGLCQMITDTANMELPTFPLP
ncbi:MAG: hypothetical protein LBB26_04530 [Puniceicoccales bacterium]|jgi:lipopolysaccharide export system protein LptA|nr:hypothetical protein [Puniceicoccales bacterium]